VDVALDGAGRPRRRQRGLDRGPVGGQAIRERLKRRQSAVPRVGEPGLEGGRITLGDQSAEALQESVPGRQVGVRGQ
jgi:hypothetical protein